MIQDIYSKVTERIIDQLEEGVVPWQSPYFATIGFPKNFSSGKAYSGINVFLLGSLRYTSPWFLTYVQAQELGGQVRKGERGALVVKYGTYAKKDDAPPVDEEPLRKRGYLKGYTVFHATQIDGIEFPETDERQERPASEACNLARSIAAAMPNPPRVEEGSALPFYRRSTDTVRMPAQKYFRTEESYYTTLFHELGHSTGHESRLARKSLLASTSIDAEGEAQKVYAEEELVAEMTASFLAAHAGIIEPEIENAVSYLKGWIDALKSGDAKTWIIRAAAQAQKASDFILNHPVSS